LGIVTLLAAAACFGVRHDFSPQAIYAGSDSLVADSEDFKAAFQAEDALLLIVLEATGPQDVLHRELLSWQAELAPRIAGMTDIERVDTLATLELPRPSLLPPFVTTAPVITHYPVDEFDEHRLRDVVDQYCLLEKTMVSVDRRVGLMIVAVGSEVQEIGPLRRVVGEVETVLRESPPPAGYRYHLGGLPALRVGIVRDLEAEQLFQIPVVGLLFLVMLACIFRSAAATLLPLISVGAAVVWTVGLMAASGMTFNLITNVLPVLLLIIGVSNCVHVIARYAGEHRREQGTQQATANTLSQMVTACFLTCLTTAIGFVSLATARSETLREFGIEAGIGMGFLYLSTILLLGAALPLFPPPRGQRHDSPQSSPTARIVASAGYAVARHAGVSLLVAGLVVACCLCLARNVVVNSHVVETYTPGHPARETFRLIENDLAGVTAVEIDLSAQTPGTFLQPDVFEAVAETAHFAAVQDDVILVRSYVDLHRQVDRNWEPRPAEGEILFSPGEDARRRLRRNHRILKRLAGSLHYEAYLNGNETRARIVCRIRDRGTRTTLGLVDRLERRMAKTFPPESGIVTRVNGEAYVYAKSMDRMIRDLLISLLGASVAVFVVIGILFRSIRVGLITTVPNLTPLVVTLGYMGLRGYELNTSNVIVFAVSLGIAVDNTIHFVARFREEMHRNGDVVEAVHRTLRSTGRAIVLTSALIVSGLAVMLFSEFLPTRRFAELTIVTMIGALFGDLLLLPASITLFWQRGGRADAVQDGHESWTAGFALSGDGLECDYADAACETASADL
jgi:predicted RND superfamily exporter protein